MKDCPFCENENLDDSEVCSSCGVSFIENDLGSIQVSTDPESFEETRDKYSKIGGWLILLAFGRVVDVLMAPITIWYQYDNLQKLKILNQYTDGDGFIAKIGILYSVILFILSIYLLILMSKGKKLFKRTMISCLLLMALYNVVMYILVKYLFDINVLHGIRTMMISIVSSTIWILYLLKSRRVENTFIY